VRGGWAGEGAGDGVDLPFLGLGAVLDGLDLVGEGLGLLLAGHGAAQQSA